MLAFGMPRLVWFKALVASNRSWTCPRSHFGMRRVLLAEKSTSENRGPRRIFRPSLPNLYWPGATNAAGLNHCAAVLLSGYKGTPETTFGSWELACEFELLEFISAVNVLPDWYWNSDDTCH